jgi:hypothetical protein
VMQLRSTKKLLVDLLAIYVCVHIVANDLIASEIRVIQGHFE